MRHGALFNGIGGFQIAAEWMGWENVMSCEIDEFCSKVTKYYWPNCLQYGDIKLTDFSIWRGKIDILTGGFPCQPFSVAGQRLGTEDDRHLWPEYYRAIREIQSPFIVGENVRGLINWSKGMVFNEVQADLEAEGYEVAPFLLPACAVNAPHRRDRICFIAQNPIFYGRLFGKTREEGTEIREQRDACAGSENRVHLPKGTTTNASSLRSGQGQYEQSIGSKTLKDWKASWFNNDGSWPTESPLCDGNDGIPTKLDGITISNWIEQSIKAGGNAIVPQVALQIFKAIEMTL